MGLKVAYRNSHSPNKVKFKIIHSYSISILYSGLLKLLNYSVDSKHTLKVCKGISVLKIHRTDKTEKPFRFAFIYIAVFSNGYRFFKRSQISLFLILRFIYSKRGKRIKESGSQGYQFVNMKPRNGRYKNQLKTAMLSVIGYLRNMLIILRKRRIVFIGNELSEALTQARDCIY